MIGPVNDVQLYRHLTGMGISDYLVRPVESEHLVEALANAREVARAELGVTGVAGEEG